MAVLTVSFLSEVLTRQVNCSVILPQHKHPCGAASRYDSAKYPTLYLLHGQGRDHTTWLRLTSIERYVSGLGLAVVMPDANISFYANIAHGGRYFDYVANELPRVMREFFPLSDAREDNFIAGQSMGGIGSLKIGLARPECFAVIGCLSGTLPSLMMQERPDEDDEDKQYRALIYGDRDVAGTEEDVAFNARKIVAEGLPAPRIYHAWGIDDFILEGARETRDFFQSLPGNPFDYTCEERPGGHNWAFWDESIRWFIAFLKLNKVEDIY